MHKTRIRALLCLLLAVIFLGTPLTAFAASGQTKNDAQNMMQPLNDFRTSRNTWYWDETNTKKIHPNCKAIKYDKDLERIAEMRAKELSKRFSHTRPNGSKFYTLKRNGTQSNAENIQTGQSTYKQAFRAFQESDQPYSGQQSRRNMLNKEFTLIGIGHYVDAEGNDFWAQEFSY